MDFPDRESLDRTEFTDNRFGMRVFISGAGDGKVFMRYEDGETTTIDYDDAKQLYEDGELS
jgi:hypothetical protein